MGVLGIPYKPRDQFRDFHSRKQRWACLLAHRRAGKTVACINDLVRAAVSDKRKNARYAYIGPYLNQTKDVAWTYITGAVQNIVAAGQAEINHSELRVDFKHNGARVRIYGADNFERIRGLYFMGVILDEFADFDPRAWPVIRPTLSDHQGWCVWIGTPKGHNEFYRVWKAAQENPDWYTTQIRASESGILADSELKDARAGLDHDEFLQEYECSFSAAIKGAYYAREFEKIDAENRIINVPVEAGHSVHTVWDLGFSDDTSIWFYQVIGREVRLVDFYTNRGLALDHYVKHLQDKGYVYGKHMLPHDVQVKELSTGRSRLETLNNLGLRVDITPNLPVMDGINAARGVLSRCWFDAKRCADGIEALRQYRREYDDKRKVFKERPLHDWCSHPADAFRYLAVGLRDSATPGSSQSLVIDNSFVV